VANGVVEKRAVAGLTLITLAGELDLLCAPGLRQELTSAPDATLPDLAIDLRQVTFMDCAVVNVFLAAYRRVTAHGGCLRLVGDLDGPLRLLHLCHLDGVLCVHDSVDVATAAVCSLHEHGPGQQTHVGACS
jgi:anti-sigma B factor antagonist